jgi:hypothetical protein
MEDIKFTLEEAKQIGNQLNIDWNIVDINQFFKGINVELEHGNKDPETNVTNSDPILTGKIAWAHLKELPDYYTRLETIEK